MTKKDYLAIAKVLHQHRMIGYVVQDSDEGPYIAEEIADVFAADNPLFDRARFLRFVETGKDTPAAAAAAAAKNNA